MAWQAVLAIGGFAAAAPAADVFVLPGAWAATGNMSVPRRYLFKAVVLNDGRALAIAGTQQSSSDMGMCAHACDRTAPADPVLHY
jgi:hypothetical protein